jgi:hypothetical protein
MGIEGCSSRLIVSPVFGLMLHRCSTSSCAGCRMQERSNSTPSPQHSQRREPVIPNGKGWSQPYQGGWKGH